MIDFFNYNRRKSSVVNIGAVPMGGEYPIRLQSMANVSTMDTEASIAQAIRLAKAGAEYIRFTAQGEREATNLALIREGLRKAGYTTPLVADIHFNPRAADVAARNVEKVRINPGNYVDRVKTFNLMDYTDEEYAVELQKIKERFVPFINLCKENNTAIRIGVNHGSLSDRIMSRYGDTPEGMVASCMEFLRICKDENFNNVVISIKASNTVIMVKTVRLLVDTMEKEGMNYPLHLGVTEAGDGEDGRIKSAVGIGTLLADGIGDTIRVSLSEEPEAEIPVADALVKYISERSGHLPIEAELSKDFDYISMSLKKTKAVENIGGDNLPIVISDRSQGDNNFDTASMPDYLYIGKKDADRYPKTIKLIVDAALWNAKDNTYPYFPASETDKLKDYDSKIKFVHLSYSDLTNSVMNAIKADSTVVVILSSTHRNPLGEQRAALQKMIINDINCPVILYTTSKDDTLEKASIVLSVDLGALLLDGYGSGVMADCPNIKSEETDRCLFGILQASRRRISKTEYISCPSCGRTLYNLQNTIAKIKAATSHLKGLKIGIMGCIVNGPGEMADADYGYVGAAKGCVSLYKGKECLKRNIPEENAVESLVELIKANGDWVDA
jgi:(E)-4-hydroxy-3-methylbut-2-enyl-diphosphate synthase